MVPTIHEYLPFVVAHILYIWNRNLYISINNVFSVIIRQRGFQSI